jgi:hypothetical protein
MYGTISHEEEDPVFMIVSESVTSIFVDVPLPVVPELVSIFPLLVDPENISPDHTSPEVFSDPDNVTIPPILADPLRSMLHVRISTDQVETDHVPIEMLQSSSA